MSLIYEPAGRAREYAALACNVYRGCDHACVYCLTGDTLILKANMSTVALADVQVGDVLLGVAKLGTGRANKNKFVESTVLHKWITRKPVYRITLANGMTARCSDDHRWLTDRGWKFVTGAMSGPDQRPYLTTNNSIRTVCDSVDTPSVTDDYMRGFLAGIYDAESAPSHFGFTYVYDKPHETPNTVVQNIRLTEGKNQYIRLWQLTNPAISRKRSIVGGSLKDSSAVVGIEPLGYDEVMYDIQTTSETFVANGMISHNCYVPSATRRQRADFVISATRGPNFLPDLEREAAKLQRAGQSGKQVLLSFTCDPYSVLDAKEAITRQVIHILHRNGFGVCVLTKGGYRALRDLDLFTPQDAFATTMTLLDNAASLAWEPGAARPQERIATLKQFHATGVTTWVSFEPVIDPAAALEIIRLTHPFTDLYKVGKMNYHPIAATIDWRNWADTATALLDQLGKRYYIKNDLRPFLSRQPGNAVTQAEIEVRPGAAPQLSFF